MTPKYARPEIERRWLVDAAAAAGWRNGPHMRIVDRYLDGTRLRLRAATSTAGTQFKLCKKYGDRDGPSESITNLYLTPAEHALLDRLPGTTIAKERFMLDVGSVDEYGSGLAIYSVEFESLEAADAFTPPVFAGPEVTTDARYTGLALASSASFTRQGEAS